MFLFLISTLHLFSFKTYFCYPSPSLFILVIASKAVYTSFTSCCFSRFIIYTPFFIWAYGLYCNRIYRIYLALLPL